MNLMSIENEKTSGDESDVWELRSWNNAFGNYKNLEGETVEFLLQATDFYLSHVEF